MGELKKVEKEITFKYHIFPDIIISPSRLEILNKLFDSPEGLSYDELVEKMSEKVGVQRHIDVLLENKIVENKNGRFTLSEFGKDFYYDLGKAAMKVKEEGLLSRSPDRQNP